MYDARNNAWKIQGDKFLLRHLIVRATVRKICLERDRIPSAKLVNFEARCGAIVEEPVCQCRRHKRHCLIPGLGRSLGGGHGNPLQYSCLENPMDRGVWRATVHKVVKSWTQLSDLACTHLVHRD